MPRTDDIFTPQAVVNILQEKVVIPIDLSSLIRIRGKYQKIGTKCYNNGYYDTIIDESYDVQLKIIVSVSIRRLLVHNQTYIFTGVIKKVILNGTIGFNIQILESPIEHKDELPARGQKILSLLEKKTNSSSKRPSTLLRDKLLEGKRPTLLCLFPESTGTKSEFFEQVELSDDWYYCIWVDHINFNDEILFKSKLREIDHSDVIDVIVILKGSGVELDIFNNLEVIDVVLEMNKPILLGAESDGIPILMRQFVDEWRENPTNTGIYLKELAEKTLNQKYISENRLREQMKITTGNKVTHLLAEKRKVEKERLELQNSNNRISKEKMDLETEKVQMKQKISALEIQVNELNSKQGVGCRTIVIIIAILWFAIAVAAMLLGRK